MPTLLMLTVLGCAATPTSGPAVDPVWQRIELLRADRLIVRLVFRQQASLVDEEWIGFEFESAGPEPVTLDDFRYDLTCAKISPFQGQDRRQWYGLADGELPTLFPENWSQAPVPPVRITNTPATRLRYPSEYSSCLMGVPPPGGVLVQAWAKVELRLEKGARLTMPGKGVPFSFEWQYPGREGFAAMQTRLAAMLAAGPPSDVVNWSLITLLDVPQVTDPIHTDDFLAGLEPRRQIGKRRKLVEFLSRSRAKDPRVLAFYRERLAAGDWNAVSDLTQAPAIWEPAYVPLVLAMYEQSNQISFSSLEPLPAHRADWPRELNVPARLSARVLPTTRYLRKQPDELKNTETFDELWYWEEEARVIAQTHDPSVIPLLLPYLDDRRRTLDMHHWAPVVIFPHFPPLRMCDVALESILTILDRDVGAEYRRAALAEPRIDRWLPHHREHWSGHAKPSPTSRPTTQAFRPEPRPEELEEAMDIIRDNLIAELKQQLAREGRR